MKNAVESSSQIVIVGGGPVGLGLAIELGQRGVNTVLIERHLHPQLIPKGQNLTQRTLEHFHFWGAEQELRAARTIPNEYGIGGMTAYGTLLGNYRYDWLRRESVRPFYFTDNERLPQYATEAVLRERLRCVECVRTLFGWTVESVEQDAQSATALIRECDGPGRRKIRADFVVGCDGSRSTVRETSGIPQTRSDHDKLMVLLVFRSTGLHDLLARFPQKSFFNIIHPDLKGYWQFFGRVDLGSTWFFHAPVPRGTDRNNFDFTTYLHKAVGASFDVEFLHVGFWDLRIATADDYRNGRVFIAGDAAHSHPPYGGYGINTGLEDAVNLGWKLDASLRGWAGPALLDTYAEERRPVFQSTARDFIEQAIRSDREFLERFDPHVDRESFEREWQARQQGAVAEVHSFEPNYAGSSIVWGPEGSTCSAVGSHQFEARAGHHLAPRQLSNGADVYEQLGSGLTLLNFDESSMKAELLERAAEKLNVPLTILTDGDASNRKFYGADLVLVRPDQFVAWTSSASASGEETGILRRVVGW